MSEANIHCEGNFDYYIFSSYGTRLFIEHNGHYPEGIFKYEFNLKEYISAVCIGFQEYLQQLEKEGILHLKNQDFSHPLCDDVLNAFDDFSSILSS